VQCQPLPKGLTEGWELKLQPSEVLAVKESPQGDKEVSSNQMGRHARF